MTLYQHELKRGMKTFWIWTVSIAAFMMMCVLFYPEMKKEMAVVSKLFASMGAFTAAFGMDKLNFGTMTGFYAVECGNIMSVGGAFFAAIISVNILSGEEKEHTAEFLLTHPVSRGRILAGKLAAVLTELILMNLIVIAATIVSFWIIHEPIPVKELSLLHLAYFICQTELALICFGISAFSRGNNFGIGLGMTLVLYFMSILANVSDKVRIFKLISPFGYAEGADIVTGCELDLKRIALGLAIGIAFAGIGAGYYQSKDITG